MRIVTVSGYKGGTGKTTIAALLGVAAVQAGLRTATLDLDRNTRNLSNFLSLRRAQGLPAPDHVMVMDLQGARTPGKPAPKAGRLEPLVRLARLDGYDLLIIDTSSGNHEDLYEAHLVADVIVTPMNESPADLHGLFTPAGAKLAPKINYRELVETVRFDRRRAGLPEQQWHVCVNRIASIQTRLAASVDARLSEIRTQANFAEIWRLKDRVAHRAISLDGRTVLDAEPAKGKLTMSELAGRMEVRALLGLVSAPAQQVAPAPMMEDVPLAQAA
jgi:cellulose biosynthesis protein BcsQ